MRTDLKRISNSRSNRGLAFSTAIACGIVAALPVCGVVGPLVSRAAAGSPACTDSWKSGASGGWDKASDWSTGKVPGQSDVACISASGSYTVTIGNETITVAALTIGGTGSTPTLAIGNSGSGLAAITVTGAVTINSGTLSFGWEGGLTAGSVTNSGTFLVPASPYTSSVTTNTFANGGSFTNSANLDLTLSGTNAALTNTGTLSVAASQTLAISSPSGQTAAIDQSGTIDNSGLLTGADAWDVTGGSICGNAPYVGAGDGGSGGSLTFPSTVTGGPACGTGVTSDNIFVPNVVASVSGTIPVGYAVSIGDGGSGFSAVTLNSVVNEGTLSFGWGGALSGSLTNAGTFVVPASPYDSTWSTTGLDNEGTTEYDANLAVTLASKTTVVTNAHGASMAVASGVTVPFVGTKGKTGSFIQDGLITNSGGTISVGDPLQINGGTICGNPLSAGSGDGGTGGKLTFASTLAAGPACGTGVATDQLFVPNVKETITTNIPKGWTVTIGDGGSGFAHVIWEGTSNAGTLIPGFGATLTDVNNVTNSGTFSVPVSGYQTVLVVGDLNNKGSVTFDASTTITSTKGLVNTKGSVALADGASVSLNGGYSQGTKATLSVVIDGGTVGLTAAKAATVAGTIDVTNASGFTPTPGEQFTLVSATPLTGTFSKVEGSYTISYPSNTVVATAA
jgi:hypothetical protein